MSSDLAIDQLMDDLDADKSGKVQDLTWIQSRSLSLPLTKMVMANLTEMNCEPFSDSLDIKFTSGCRLSSELPSGCM
nr:unnamed protein product [Spirometra erinaceieuropaei]